MNILYYHQHFSTPKGSTGTRSYEFAKKLIEKGHSVTLVCGSYWLADSGLSHNFNHGKREGFVENIKVIELELEYSNSDSFLTRSITFLRFAWKGIAIALTHDYDLIFATSTPLTAGLPGIFANYFKRKPFIFEVRDLWPELPKAMGVIKNPVILKLMDLLETLSYRSATACIGLSPGIVDGIRKKVPNKNLSMIPNGCDLDLVNYKNKDSKNDKLIAVFTGAHGFANGLDSVLDVAKILINKNIHYIEFRFIGDGVLKPHLIDRSKKEGLTNCIFLNPMPKEKLFSYLQNYVDLGLMILDNIPAFYRGTSPNKFFDYIALGLPVLNNYPGWLADMIVKNNCGIAIQPNDPNAFAEVLVNMKKDKHKMLEMGQNAKKLAINKFDRNKLSNQFVALLESNLNNA